MNSLIENFRDLNERDRQDCTNRLAELLAMENPDPEAAHEVATIAQRLGLKQSDMIDLGETLQTIRAHLRTLDDEQAANERSRNARINYLQAKKAAALLDDAIAEEIKRHYFANLAAGAQVQAVAASRRAMDQLRASRPELVKACIENHVAKPGPAPVELLPWAELLHPTMPSEPEAPKPESPAPVAIVERTAPASEAEPAVSGSEPPLLAPCKSAEEMQREKEIDDRFAADLETKGRGHVRPPRGDAFHHLPDGTPRVKWRGTGKSTQT